MSDPCKQDLTSSEIKKILLVEGNNDCHLVMGLCKKQNVTENFSIQGCNGIDKALKILNSLIARPDPPEVIGAVLDADKSIMTQWNRIQKKLQDCDDNFPQNPMVNGTIIQGYQNKPKLGFWLMPNNIDAGIVEDFCIELVPQNRQDTFRFAQECVAEAKNRKLTDFKDQDYSKAELCTYLAWQDKPGFPPGKAIGTKKLNADAELAKHFTDWLKQLFG